jgi:uncharacterized membrane protein/tetratricopeptide (TPR) repeat protein
MAKEIEDITENENSTEVIQLDKNDATLYSERGKAYFAQKDYDGAIKEFAKAIQLAPHDARVYYFRGVAYANKGDNDQAITDLTAAVRRNPNNATWAAALEKVKAAAPKPPPPKPQYATSAPTQKSAEPKAPVRLDTHHATSAPAQKPAEPEAPVPLDAIDATSYSERGIAFLCDGDYDQAIAEFTAALRLNPNNAALYTDRSFAYSAKGDHDRAIADLTAAVRLDPHDVTSVDALKKAQAAAGHNQTSPKQHDATPRSSAPLTKQPHSGRGKMAKNSELRAMARAQLRGSWLATVAMELVFSTCMVLSLFILSGPLVFGLVSYYVKKARGESVKLEHILDGFKIFGSSFLLLILEGIFLTLWSYLFIIPGIVKFFSYSMAFFILRDNPEIGAAEAITQSRKMMDGYKGKLFMLHLSFIGWFLLCCLSGGIGFWWLYPYISLSVANFYEDLRQNQPEIIET